MLRAKENWVQRRSKVQSHTTFRSTFTITTEEMVALQMQLTSQKSTSYNNYTIQQLYYMVFGVLYYRVSQK